MINESPQERRIRETLERCNTEEQICTVKRLHAVGKTVYPENRRGEGVVAEFRSYLTTRDPEKIRQGLYRFSMGGAGGLNEIAHFNLDGFRSVYHHPTVYLERLLYPCVERMHHDPHKEPDGFHSQYVYTDGLTAGEVLRRILNLADEHREVVTADYADKERAAVLAEAQRLAAVVGMKVVAR